MAELQDAHQNQHEKGEQDDELHRHHPVFPVNGFGGPLQRDLAPEDGRAFWRVLVRHGLPPLAHTDLATRRELRRTTRRYDLGLGVTSFELDFWGRVAALNEAAKAQYLASGEAAVYDFPEQAPAAASPTMFLKDGRYSSELHHDSPISVGVPGLPSKLRTTALA